MNNLTERITERDGTSATRLTNLESTPLDWIADPGQLDFHLTTAASGAVDQGTARDDLGLDLDDEPHTLGSAPDLGADERE